MDSGEAAAKGMDANGEEGSIPGTLPAQLTAATCPTIFAAPNHYQRIRKEVLRRTYEQGDSQDLQVPRDHRE